MIVYKTKTGYHYKKYCNGKKKRISKNEYEKLKVKLKVKNKKGGSSNTSKTPHKQLTPHTQLIVYNHNGLHDTFLLPCYLLPSSLINYMSESRKYSKFLQNEMVQGLYNNNMYKKFMSSLNVDPKYPTKFLDILKSSYIENVEQSYKNKKVIKLETKWWYKVIDYGRINTVKPVRSFICFNDSKDLLFRNITEIDSLKYSKNHMNPIEASLLAICSTDFNTYTPGEYRAIGCDMKGGEYEPKPKPEPEPIIPIPPPGENTSQLDYNYTDYTEVDGVYMSSTVYISNKYKDQILAKLIADSEDAVYFLNYYYNSNSYNENNNSNNNNNYIREARNILYENCIKYINIDNFITLIKIENGKIIKMKYYFAPFLFLFQKINLLNIRSDGIIYNSKIQYTFFKLVLKNCKKYMEEQKNIKLMISDTITPQKNSFLLL
jgi:hypothetical protein